MEHNEGFHFTYSAARQKEIEQIRSKYLPKEEDKMERLRALHRSATQKANIAAISVGTLGALALGCGMSLFMTDFGAALDVWSMPVGIVIGVAGLVLTALAWPIHRRVLRQERERIAPEILRLSEELMKH